MEVPKKNDREGGEPDMLSNCMHCGKEIPAFHTIRPSFCPNCGLSIDPRTVEENENATNVITGRALWKPVWALLIPAFCFGLLFGITSIIQIIALVPMVLFIVADPANAGMPFPELLDLVMDSVLNLFNEPWVFLGLSMVQIVFVIVPLLLLKKYRPIWSDRIKLLGWQPYFIKTRDGQGIKETWKPALNSITRDVLISLFYALGMVGISVASEMIGTRWFFSQPGVQDPMEGVGSLISPAGPVQLIVLIITMLAIVGPTEEILFRGYSQQSLETYWGEKKAILVSSIFFMAIHVLPLLVAGISALLYAIPYFFVSLVLCSLYAKNKRINKGIYTHGIYNSMLIIFQYLSGFPALFPMLDIMVFVLMGLGGLLVFYLLYHLAYKPWKARRQDALVLKD